MPSEEWTKMIEGLGKQYGTLEKHPLVSPGMKKFLGGMVEGLKGMMSNAPAGDLLRLAGVSMPERRKSSPEDLAMENLFLSGGILKADAVEKLASFLRLVRKEGSVGFSYVTKEGDAIAESTLRLNELSPYADEAVRATMRTPQEALDEIKRYYFNALEQPHVSGRYNSRGPNLTINPRSASPDVVPHEMAHHLTSHPVGEEMSTVARTIRVNENAMEKMFGKLQQDAQFDMVDEAKFYAVFDPNERVSREFARRLPAEELSWEEYSKLYTDVAKEVAESSNAQLDYLEQVMQTSEGLLPQDVANLTRIGQNPKLLDQFITKPRPEDVNVDELVDRILEQ